MVIFLTISVVVVGGGGTWAKSADKEQSQMTQIKQICADRIEDDLI